MGWSSPVLVRAGVSSSFGYRYKNGEHHLSVVDSGVLYYLHGALASSLSIETIDDSGLGYSYSDLEVTDGGDVHVCFYDATSDDLYYAVDTGGGFAVELVTSSNDSGAYCRIRVDGSGCPHIAYRYYRGGGFQGGPRWAKKDGAWTIENAYATGSSNGNFGRYVALELDGSDVPYLSCECIDSGGNRRVFRCARTGGTWSESRVAYGMPAGHNAFAFDADGYEHWFWHDTGDTTLRHRTNRGGWTNEIVDTDGYAGYYCWAVSIGEWVYCVSYHPGNDELRIYRLKTTYAVDGELEIPFPLRPNHGARSIAQDVGGAVPGVMFYDSTEGGIYYTTLDLDANSMASLFM